MSKFYFDAEGNLYQCSSISIPENVKSVILDNDVDIDTYKYINDALVLKENYKEILKKRSSLSSKQDVYYLRQHAYQMESDPLFMEWQYDKSEEKENIWRSKVAEIKERYPLPE